MRWSAKVGQYAGIGVYIHATFYLLLAWVGFVYWRHTGTMLGVATGIAFVLALFLCVVLHEYGHALTARRYGIRTRDITLYPIGGVARLERMPDKPMQELWVALAGPAVNVVIAIGLYAFLALTHRIPVIGDASMTQGGFIQRLMVLNVFLAVFNMIPAFPMDGGRVLRALLATRLEYSRATGIAASIGQGIALIFGFLGFLYNPFLILIAVFVWIGAAQEASMAQMRSALGGIPVARAIVTDFRALRVGESLSRAVELILAGSQHDFPVLDGERVAGVLTRADLMAALASDGQDATVDGVMRREFEVADRAEMLEGAFQRLAACKCHTMPVLWNGQLVGLLTMENVGEFFMIQSALGGPGRRAAPPPGGLQPFRADRPV